MCVSQLLAVIAVRRAEPPRRWLWIAVGVAVACRVPLMVGPVNYDSDMIRYVYDGRVQRFGYNPYAIVPSDPALAHTHTTDTVRMPFITALPARARSHTVCRMPRRDRSRLRTRRNCVSCYQGALSTALLPVEGPTQDPPPVP